MSYPPSSSYSSPWSRRPPHLSAFCLVLRRLHNKPTSCSVQSSHVRRFRPMCSCSTFDSGATCDVNTHFEQVSKHRFFSVWDSSVNNKLCVTFLTAGCLAATFLTWGWVFDCYPHFHWLQISLQGPDPQVWTFSDTARILAFSCCLRKPLKSRKTKPNRAVCGGKKNNVYRGLKSKVRILR